MLVEAPAPSFMRTAIVLGNTEILCLRDCKSLLLDKQISPPGWAAIHLKQNRVFLRSEGVLIIG